MWSKRKFPSSREWKPIAGVEARVGAAARGARAGGAGAGARGAGAVGMVPNGLIKKDKEPQVN